jgi:raffinose/stachyose/melibiose transport system substrate-binding protein
MKKFCSILLSVLLLTAFLTSCTPPPAETSAEAPAASSGPENTGGKIIITLLQFKIDIADRVMKMAEDFNNSQSQINLAATVEGDEYNTLIKSRFAAGNAPDIFFTAGYSDIVRWKENTVDLTNEPWVDKIYDSAIDGIAVDGKVYGMPIGFEGYGLHIQ